MKLRCLKVLAPSLLLTINSIAQGPGSGSGVTQWKTNGNIADSSHFFGTKNNFPVRFKTDNIERLRISPEGNVGIGLSNPMAKLDVLGNVILRNNLTLSGLPLSNGLNNDILFTDASGNITRGPITELQQLVYSKQCPDDPSADILHPVWVNGTNKIYVDCPPVWVGIGTSSPIAKLDVRGNNYISGFSGIGIQPENSTQLFVKTTVSSRTGLCVSVPNAADNTYGFKLNTQNDNHKAIAITRLDSGEDAFVVYGNGQLWSTGVHVRSIGNFPDYVFESNYKLLPLNELKSFIEKEKHLPKMPTAFQVETEGADLMELNRLLVEKVEELTLYIIDQDSKIQQLTNEQEKISELKKEIEDLKQIVLSLKN